VGAEIVHHDNVAGLQCRHENLLDVGKKGVTVDGTVEHEGRRNFVVAKRGEKGQRFPVTVRDFGDERLAAPVPAARARHVGFGPGLVDEDEASGINQGLVFFPTHAASRDVGTVLLGGVQGFF